MAFDHVLPLDFERERMNYQHTFGLERRSERKSKISSLAASLRKPEENVMQNSKATVPIKETRPKLNIMTHSAARLSKLPVSSSRLKPTYLATPL